MKFSNEIKEAFWNYSGIFMMIIGLMAVAKSLDFALHMMKIPLIVSSVLSGLFFVKKNNRLFNKNEYFQMIGFGTFVYLTVVGYLFYRIQGIGFVKIIMEYHANLDVAIWLSSLVIILAPTLMMVGLYSKFIMKNFLKV